MRTILTEGNRLVIDGIEIKFRFEIREYLEYNDFVVVRLAMRTDKDSENNIYGVIDGEIAWRVQDMLEYNKNCAPFIPDPYVGIDVYDKDKKLVIATTFAGFRYLINPNNGRIIGEESWVK